MAKAKKVKPINAVAYWEPMQVQVEIVSMGHFPDTVMVKYNDKQCEVDVRDLTEPRS